MLVLSLDEKGVLFLRLMQFCPNCVQKIFADGIFVQINGSFTPPQFDVAPESATMDNILQVKMLVLFSLVLVLSLFYCMLFPFGGAFSVCWWLGLFLCL